MFRQNGGVPLGRILGIPISLDYSWFIIAALLSLSLAQGYYPSRYAAWPESMYWVMGTITALALFGSVLLHELGHSIAAMLFDIPVHRIRLMIFGGVAELGDESPTAAAEFIIAIAGPLVSFLVAGASFLIAGPLGFFWRAPDIGGQAFLGLMNYMAIVNLMLAIFNMVPGFPLDGGRVLRAVLWGFGKDYAKATNTAVRVGQLVSFGFFLWGGFQIVRGDFASGIWIIFIGIFLRGAGKSEQRMQRTKQLLEGRQVAHLMMHNPSISRWAPYGSAVGPEFNRDHVSPDMDLWTALKTMDRSQLRQIPVILEGRLLGIIRREDIFGYLKALQRTSFSM